MTKLQTSLIETWSRFLFASFTYWSLPPRGLDHDRFDVPMFRNTKLPHGGPAEARPPRFTRNINWIPFRNPFLRSRKSIILLAFESETVTSSNIKKSCLRQKTPWWCLPGHFATLCHMASLGRVSVYKLKQIDTSYVTNISSYRFIWTPSPNQWYSMMVFEPLALWSPSHLSSHGA